MLIDEPLDSEGSLPSNQKTVWCSRTSPGSSDADYLSTPGISSVPQTFSSQLETAHTLGCGTAGSRASGPREAHVWVEPGPGRCLSPGLEFSCGGSAHVLSTILLSVLKWHSIWSAPLKRKVREAKPMATYPCQLCGKMFLTLEKFTIHNYSHSRERPYKCLQPECGKAFISRYKLMRHMATHSSQKSHQCAHCEKTFNRKDHLKNHLQTHDPNKMAFGCEECGKKYHTLLGYKRHLALHAASSGDLTCGVCALELGSTEVLLDHLKAHAEEKPSTGTKEKKHQCDHCERCFYTRKDVRRHLVVHTGCKDFLCQFCAQRFGRKDHLTRHTKKTHSQELMKESLQSADFLNTFHSISPQFQLKAAPLSPYPIGAPAQNGLAGGLPPEVHGHALNPPEQACPPMQPLPEGLVPLHPIAPPNSPQPPLQNHKYTGSTSYTPLANLSLKADTKGFCNINLLEDLPLQEPQSPHKLNPGFDLAKGGAGKVNLPKELPADAVNLTIPASLEISPLLGFWQLPPPAPQNAFGNSALTLGPGDALPHRLGCLGQQQQDPSLAMSTMSLGQLPLPPNPPCFPSRHQLCHPASFPSCIQINDF